MVESPPMSDIHRAAQQGFSVEAETYTRGRPEYPAAMLPWLMQVMGIDAGSRAIDLGAGTGKFTKLLVQAGADVIAVEPVEAMRAQLASGLPQVRTLAGSAQAIPVDSVSADAVVCAQAFHWFATREALAEIHRVLKPGGRLGLVWNVRDESVDWVAAITKIITPYEGDAPRFHTGRWREPFPGSGFTELQETSFVHQHVGTAQEVILDRFLSVSFIAALPVQQKAKVAQELAALAASHPALRGRDTIVFPYRTQAFWCSRAEPG